MTTFDTIFIFLLITFVYLHISAQWKTSNDLEVFESDMESVAQIQDVVAIKQPVVFKSSSSSTGAMKINPVFRAIPAKFQDMEVRVYNDVVERNERPSKAWISLPYRSARSLLDTDTASKYFSEGNQLSFMEETGLDRVAATMVDGWLRPPLAIHSSYDLMFGAPHVYLPLRYHIRAQQYLVVCSGKIRVKVAAPKYTKIIGVVKDYDAFEFRSPVDPAFVWSTNVGSASASTNPLKRVAFLEIDVYAGSVLYIPPYWWHSIQYSGDTTTTILNVQYDTLANLAAQSKEWIQYAIRPYVASPREKKGGNNHSTQDKHKQETPPDQNEHSSSSSSSSSSASTAVVKNEDKHKTIVTNANTYDVL